MVFIVSCRTQYVNKLWFSVLVTVIILYVGQTQVTPAIKQNLSKFDLL